MITTIILSFIAVLSLTVSIFIVYRYNALADEHFESVDQMQDLLERFDDYVEVLETIENSEVLVFDPLIGRLVEEGRGLAQNIETVRAQLEGVIEEDGE